jgi:hypothetical protein
MDNDEEMIQEIMDDEAACEYDVREHLAIIACLQKCLMTPGEEEEATPWRFNTRKKEVDAPAEARRCRADIWCASDPNLLLCGILLFPGLTTKCGR